MKRFQFENIEIDEKINCESSKKYEHVLDEFEEIKLVFQAWLSYAKLKKIKSKNQKMKN